MGKFRLVGTIVLVAALAVVMVASLPAGMIGAGMTPTVDVFLPVALKPENTPTTPPSPTLTPIPTSTPTPTATPLPPADIRIMFIEYNPPGPDEDGEFVRIVNLGGTTQTMTNWTLRDIANHVFTFPGFSLPAGGAVQVWTGIGTNNSSNLYWESGAAIWNNTGDTATLRNNSGQVISVCSYPGGEQNYNCP